MIVRKYIVLNQTRDGKKTRFCVSDALNEEEYDTRPSAAEFPISEHHDERTQVYRAMMYRDYLNKIAEATEVAYQQTMLCDILKT